MPDAVTLKVYAPAGVPLTDKPAQPVVKKVADTINRKMSKAPALTFLCRAPSPMQSKQGRRHKRIPEVGFFPSAAVEPAPSGSPVSTINCTVVVPLATRLTCGVLKVQVAAFGSPRQPSCKVSEKPASEVRVTVVVACCLLWSVRVEGLSCTVNCVAVPPEMVVAREVELA